MKNHIKKILLLLLILMPITEPHASTMDPLIWAKNVLKEEDWQNRKFPYKVIFIKKLQPEADIFALDLSAASFNRYGFLKTISDKNIKWSFKLNKFERFQPIANNKQIRTFSIFSKLADLDTVIFAPDDGEWFILTKVGNNLKKISMKYNFKDINTHNIYSWFTKTTGFNGVVIDVNENQLLVGSLNSLLKPGEQGVIYRQSQGILRLNKEQQPASAIIECVASQAGFGIFKVIISDSKIFQGDKIFIVKS